MFLLAGKWVLFVCFQSLCKRAIEVCSNAVSKRSTEKNATVQKDKSGKKG